METPAREKPPTDTSKWPQSKIVELLENITLPEPLVNQWGENLPNIEPLQRKLVASSDSLGIFGKGPLVKAMEKQLNAIVAFSSPNLKKIKDVDTLIAPSPWGKIGFLARIQEHKPDTNLILWWTGTDVLRVIDTPPPGLPSLKATHLCVSPNLQRELQHLGIKASILPIPPAIHRERLALPSAEPYTVVSYIPKNKLSFYGFEQVIEVATMCPKIRFIVFGAASLDLPSPSNVEIRGWIADTRKLFEKSHCLLRLTHHDGFPKCIMEAKQHHRVVITNQNLPYVVQMNEPEKIATFLKTHPQPSEEGYDYYQQLTYNAVRESFSRDMTSPSERVPEQRWSPRRQDPVAAEKAVRRIKKVWASATEAGEEIPTLTDSIKLSVIIPYYRAGYIGWIPFESLVRQAGIDFQWELVIMEESCDNPFGYSRMLAYWDDLKKVGCCRLRYISLPKWIPLSGKWYYLINSTAPSAEVICCNASDIYMSHKRLATQMKVLGGDSPYNWHKLSGNLVYDLGSDSHVKLVGMDKKRPDTCCRAASRTLLKELSLVSRATRLDTWMYKNLASRINFYYDTSDLWYDTVNINGLNNITHNRSSRVQNVTPPFTLCCDKFEKHLPLEVVSRLRSCREHLPDHQSLLEATKK